MDLMNPVRTKYATITTPSTIKPWWRHQMELFSALLAICAGNSPVHDEFPAQRPVTRGFDVFTRDASAINHLNYLENSVPKISFNFPRGQWVKDMGKWITFIDLKLMLTPIHIQIPYIPECMNTIYTVLCTVVRCKISCRQMRLREIWV